MSLSKILYLGDQGILELPVDKLKKRINSKIVHLPLEKKERIFEPIILHSPDLILIEALEVDSNYLSFLLLLKSHHKLKNTVIVAVFPDENNLTVYSDIFSFGVQYGFMAGEEIDKIISDIGYIIDQDQNKIEKYATATNLNIDFDIRYNAKVSHFSKKNIFIESSVNFEQNEVLEAKYRVSDEVILPFFNVEEESSFFPRSFFNKSYTLSYIFDDTKGKDLELTDSITTKSDFEKKFPTFIKGLHQRNDHALIIDRSNSTLSELMSEFSVNNRFIKAVSLFDHFSSEIKFFRPQIICFQMDAELEDMTDDELSLVNGPTTFNRLISLLKSLPNYSPYLLVFSEKSRSQAYRKAYDYANIITNKKHFELSYLQMIIEEYQKANPILKDNYFIRPPDAKSIFLIKDTISITSISENVITFLSTRQLDLFTSFKLEAPFNIYLTVVPPDRLLNSTKTHTHYMGFISCASENDKMELRRIVNLLIQLDLKENETFELKSAFELKEDIILAKKRELEIQREKEKVEYKDKED